MLYVYTDGPTKTQKMNISSTWWEDVKQSYTRRLPGLPTWPSNFVALFEDMMENGSYGVVMINQPAGKTVTIFATDDENSYCDFSGPNNNDWIVCHTAPGSTMVRAEYITHNSYGGNGCWGNSCSDNGINIYEQPNIRSSSGASTVWGAPLSEMRSGYVSFFMMDFDIQYPTGYEGEIVPEEPSLLEYVAMGDSFSSGEGVPAFMSGTDVSTPNENRCHRSAYAYPRLLEQDFDLNYDLRFVACSGATTYNILNDGSGMGSWDEGAQIDTLSNTTDIVTLTIGGNDVGFSDYLTGCLVACGPFTGSLIHNAMLNGINANAFKSNLVDTYTEVLSEAENAEVYVLSYPNLSAAIAGTCEGFDFSGARIIQDALNSVISDAVDDVNDDRLHFVDTNAGGSPFEGKHLCNLGAPYFNGFEPWGIQEYSFHPNAHGHTAFKTILEDELE